MRIFYTIAFVTLSCVACFGQSSYKGLTPGQSTRADVERVLGRPVKDVSKTLIEYKSPESVGKLFVQYHNDSPTAMVQRIELICYGPSCGSVRDTFEVSSDGVLPDARSRDENEKQGRLQAGTYYGAPRFIVKTLISKFLYNRNPDDYEMRVGFYSKELYESAVPKGGCTGTIFGTWQTERGRMTIVRVGDNSARGTYAKNKGTFSINRMPEWGYNEFGGEWSDDTGSGLMALLLGPSVSGGNPDSLSATFSRDSAAPLSSLQISLFRIEGRPPGEPLTGKCVP